MAERKKRKKRPPAVPGLLIAEGNESKFRYKVQYDCPWCGKEHIIKLIENPPVEIVPDCGRGVVNLHRFEPPVEI